MLENVSDQLFESPLELSLTAFPESNVARTRDSSALLADVICCVRCTMESMATSGLSCTRLRGRQQHELVYALNVPCMDFMKTESTRMWTQIERLVTRETWELVRKLICAASEAAVHIWPFARLHPMPRALATIMSCATWFRDDTFTFWVHLRLDLAQDSVSLDPLDVLGDDRALRVSLVPSPATEQPPHCHSTSGTRK